MSVATLSNQCIAYVVNHLMSDSLKLPYLPSELCQEIITYILRDRRLKRKNVEYLSEYWSTVLTKLFSSCNSPPFLDFSSSTINGSHLHMIADLCGTLTGLNLSGNKLVSSESISHLGKVSSLKYLNLSKCPLVDSNCLIALSKKAFNLQSLSLERCDITDAGVIAIAGAFPNLASLILAHCSQISDAAICKLADSCTKLEVLSLKMSRRVSDKSISKIFSQLVGLRSINLENCQRITDNSFTTFACPSLAHLNINFCTRITTKSLLKIVGITSILETIRVQQVRINGDEGIAEMGEFIIRCKLAKKVNIVGVANSISPMVLENIQLCENIKSFSFGSADGPQGGDPLSPELSDTLFKNLGQLEKLLFDTIRVTPQTIETVAKYTPHLKQLNFRWNFEFGDATLRAIANAFPYLERLTILTEIGPTFMTDMAVVDLCKKCPGLMELKFVNCSTLSDLSVEAIASLKKLQRLTLSNSKISDEAIKKIATLIDLRELDISGCPFLSCKAVELLATPAVLPSSAAPSSSPLPSSLSKLEKLSWEGMLWMKDPHVVTLIEAFPLLNHLYLSECHNVTGNSVTVKDMDLVVYLERKDLRMD